MYRRLALYAYKWLQTWIRKRQDWCSCGRTFLKTLTWMCRRTYSLPITLQSYYTFDCQTEFQEYAVLGCLALPESAVVLRFRFPYIFRWYPAPVIGLVLTLFNYSYDGIPWKLSFLVMSGIFCNFNKAIAESPKVGRSRQVRIFDGFNVRRGLTGTSWHTLLYRYPLRIYFPIHLVETQASTWMSKVCCKALEIKPVPRNPCSPREWFPPKSETPFNACGISQRSNLRCHLLFLWVNTQTTEVADLRLTLPWTAMSCGSTQRKMLDSSQCSSSPEPSTRLPSSKTFFSRSLSRSLLSMKTHGFSSISCPRWTHSIELTVSVTTLW